jgi:glycosyltransferase involved in cell wall biosynthesis
MERLARPYRRADGRRLVGPVSGTPPMRKVVIVNTADHGGGAERMAMMTLAGFQALGTETWLAVGTKRTAHPRVVAFHSSPHVDYKGHARVVPQLALAARRGVERRLGVEDFNHPFTRHLLDLTGSRPELVLCENLHGGYFDLRMLASLSWRVPVVLRLSDSWLFTGHCACPLGCARWESGCGSCPDLSIPPAVQRDATSLNWSRKRRIFAASRLFVVTPSHWLGDRARRSILAPAVQGWAVVPNGVDVEAFTPGARDEARRALGIDAGSNVLVFVANSGSDNPYKDFATIRAAMARIAQAGAPAAVELLAVGKEGPEERLGAGVSIRHLPRPESERRLVSLYRAADLYVHAAAEETFCLTAAEALACGTPVVAAATGGIAEVVDDGRTGLVMPPGRPAELAAAVRGLLDDPLRRERMSAAGVESVRARFDQRVTVAELHAQCREAAALWRTPLSRRGDAAAYAAAGSNP